MAYYGTTASSSLSNPPINLMSVLGGINNASGGRSFWLYTSADTTGTVAAANYFTDAKVLGMSEGDPIVVVVKTSAGTTDAKPYLGCVVSVSTSGATINTLTA